MGTLKGRWSLVTRNGPGTGLPWDAIECDAMARQRSAGKLKICELFSPPRLSSLGSCEVEFTSPPNFDFTTGWEFFDALDRAAFWKCLRDQKPDLVTMSPECRPISILMNSNRSKMEPGEALRLRTQGLAMLQFCVQVAEYQISRGKFFWLEQPATASSLATHAVKWLLEQRDVCLLRFDQCAAGLPVVPDTLSKKPTASITNHVGLMHELSKLQCDGSHTHQPLESGLPKKAQRYPVGLLQAMLHGVRWQLKREQQLFSFIQRHGERARQ